MKYLLDTHIILWALINDNRLNDKVKNIILSSDNEIYYSTVSIWEVEIKHNKDKRFKLSGESLASLCDQNYLLNLPIHNKHVYKIKEIENTVNYDPFDRMLLAQAKVENMTLITHDKKMKGFDNKNIMIV